ncbi:ABCB family ABC transporter ATP-binding protein/permease [Planctobacterium marinum]|uniref:ABC transporter n=1 Tax=Planctobacterium marinum TaxID=1631968 RepID=A0AA48KR30_9ALTE|nr:ABC transporter [Planctobacterium marinum]
MRRNRFPVDENTEINWRVLLQLWPYLTEFKSRVFLALLCLIAAKLANIGLPFVLKHTVDGLNTDDTTTQILAATMALVVAYGVLRLSTVLFGEIRDTLFGRVTERAMRRVGLKVFQHLHALDLDFHINRQTGGLSRDIERGTSGIGFLMRFMVFNIIPTLFEILAVVGVLFVQYGFEFAAIILGSVITYVLFSMKATDWRTRFVKEMNQADSSTNTRAIDSLLNYETVKYFNNETYEANRYDKDLAEWESARRKNRLSLFALNGGQALIISSAMTAMMAMAAWNVAQGNMTIGDFVLINAMTMQIFMPLNFLGFVYREIRGSLANIENMFGLLKKQPQVEDQTNATSLSVSSGKILFDAVNFHYHSDRPILKDVSFTIQPGEKVAIVGPSGSGKSTLIKLLFRFYDVTSGTISIDGQNIAAVTQDSLRTHIGIVPQDTVLFNDSILENVRYGRTDATDEEVREALEMAHLTQFIENLPDGWDTKVGERGLKLSGGEKQRVAIARTILKRPPILLFDEATSSLDSQSERAILQAFNEIAEGHTSIVIAHRLSTIIDADQILVIERGELKESGNHQQLLAEKGVYYALWQAQQKDQTADKTE